MKAEASFPGTRENLAKRLVSIFLLSTSLAMAQSNLSQGLLECSATSNVEDRLAYYDAVYCAKYVLITVLQTMFLESFVLVY